MRGSWNGSIRIAGDVNEINEVGQWLLAGSLQWPSETLVWLTTDGPEPTWVEAAVLLDEIERRDRAARLAEVKEIARRREARGVSDEHPVDEESEGFVLDLVDIRRWRQQIREAAEVNKELETWSSCALLDGTDVSIQVNSNDIAGRWSGFTLAVFADVGESLPKDSVSEDRWVRFDPQEPEPCRSWVVIFSNGMVIRMQEQDEWSVSIDLEHRDLSDPEALVGGLGSGLIRTTEDRLDVAMRDLPIGPASWGFLEPNLARESGTVRTGAKLKSYDCSMDRDPIKDHKFRLTARWNLSPRPRLWNLLTPMWPIARAITKRRTKKVIAAGTDKMMSTDDWSRVLELSRRGPKGHRATGGSSKSR